jgi:hypothetical protein
MSAGSSATAAVLAGAALACAWRSAPGLWPSPAPAAQVLRACAGLLAALSMAYALNMDSWVLQQGRAAAQEAGLYAWRRPLQAGLLVFAALTTIFAVRRVWRHTAGFDLVCACGAAAALVLFCMRAVSLHGVDAVMDGRCFGVGLGRWLEWAAGTMVVAATVLHAGSAAKTTPPLRAWRPHV